MAVRFLRTGLYAIDRWGFKTAPFAQGAVASLLPEVERDLIQSGLAVEHVEQSAPDETHEALGAPETADAAPEEAPVVGPEAAAVAGPSEPPEKRRRGRPRKRPLAE